MEDNNEFLREVIHNAKALREDAITLLHVMREALSCPDQNRIAVENLLYRESIDFVVCFTGLIEDMERATNKQKK